jgi:hypothetical protein
MSGIVNITIEGAYTIIDIVEATPKYGLQTKSIPNEDIMFLSDNVKNQLQVNADGVNYYFENSEVIIPTGADSQAKMESLLASLDLQGASEVNISKNQLGFDAWGRAKTMTDESLFSGLFTSNVPVTMWKEKFNTVERVPTNATSLNGKLNIVAGATLSDVTVLESFRNLRYQPNRGHLFSTAGYMVNPAAAMKRDFGTFTEESGVFFRVKTDGLYAVVATTVNASYSEDEQLITLPPGVDLSKGNTYDIQFQWRGVGDYKFFINLELVHTIGALGLLTELTMFNPSNPCAFRSENLGDNDPMQFGCVDITSEGGTPPKGQYGSISMDSTSGQIALTGFNTPVMAIRSKLIHNGLRNTRDTLSLLASGYSDQKSLMRIWATRDFTAITEGTQAWKDFGDGHLEYMILDPATGTPMTFDTAKAFPAIFGSRVGQDDTYSTSALFEGRAEVYQTPGDMFVITLHRENGGASNGGVTYEFAEEI